MPRVLVILADTVASAFRGIQALNANLKSMNAHQIRVFMGRVLIM